MTKTTLSISFGKNASDKGNEEYEVRKSHAELLRKASDFNPVPIDVKAYPGQVFALKVIFELDQKSTPLERKEILVRLYDKEISEMFNHEVKTFEIKENK